MSADGENRDDERSDTERSDGEHAPADVTQPLETGLLGTPQRQLPIAIVAEFFSGAALRQFGEVLVPALFVSVASGGRPILVLLPLAVVVAVVLSVLRWWRTRFWVENDELILEKGLLNRTRLQVPLDRIQQISTEQGIVQQIFDVRKVSIDTAGSAGVEFSLSAIGNDIVAELRQLVVGADRTELPPPLARDLVAGQVDAPIGPPSIAASDLGVSGPTGALVNAASHSEAVLHMSWRDLVQVGLVRPGGQVLSGLLALLGLGVGGAVDSFVENRITSTIAAVSFMVGGLLFAFTALIGGAVLRDFELTVWRSEQGLRLTAGLLTKREQFARTERVQLVRRRANPLERLLERTTVVLPQASATAGLSSSSSGPQTQNFMVPSVPNDTVDRVTSLFLHDPPLLLGGAISPRARWRWGLYGAGWPAALLVAGGAVIFGFDGPVGLGITLFVLAVGVFVTGAFVAAASQRRWRWQLDPTVLRTRHGVAIDQRSDVELRKIQSVGLHQGWWQRRNGLASITCSTAGGSVEIPHLDVAVAESIRDRVLAAVERSEGPWM